MTSAWPHPPRFSALDLAIALELPPPTPEQQAVIEAPPYPALVVAGAGSGKTETMSARVVWLVANGYANRDQVLGLTFTRKAAGELAERINRRLDQLRQRGLGPNNDDPNDRLLRPHVSTYNAFADALVRQYAAQIGRDPDAVLLSGAASWILAAKVVEQSAHPQLIEREEAFTTLVDAVLKLSGELTDHRADAASVSRWGAETAARLEPHINPELQTPREIERAHRSLTGLPLVTALAQEYRNRKLAGAVFDYADQVAGALEAALKVASMRDELRSRYRFVLLDEYQDTSVTQTRLLAELFAQHPVMAVGDPQQSIYSWRGASADNLEAFPASFAPSGQCERYALSTSWRNDRAILTAANALMAGRGATVLELQPRPAAGQGQVTADFFVTLDEEVDAVAAWFVAEREAHGRANPRREPHTGAILFRKRRYMSHFADALAARGVPCRVLGIGGLLDTPEITDLVATLRVLTDPHEGSSLLRLLAGARFEVGVADLGQLERLASELAKRDGSLRELDDEARARARDSVEPDEKASIIDALDRIRTLGDDSYLLRHFSDEGRVRLQEASELFARLRRALSLPIPELLRLIENELGLDIELAANEQRGSAARATAQLRAFGDEVRGFLAADERGSVRSLLAWLDHVAQSDELKTRIEPVEPGVVQLLTVHGSKGLEWDSVAVAQLGEGDFPGGAKSKLGWLALGELPATFRGDGAALPQVRWPLDEADSKAHVQAIRDFTEDVKLHGLAEEYRLAYVAVTRAKSGLLLTGAKFASGTRGKKPSVFFAPMLEALGLEPLPEIEVHDNPQLAQPHLIRWPLDPLGSRRERVLAAAEAVRQAQPSVEPDPLVAQLLAERDRIAEAPAPPVRVSASTFKDYLTDFAATVQRVYRPVPERPYTQTRIGTMFHEWVEHRALGQGVAVPAGIGGDDLFESAGLGDEFDDPIGASALSPREQAELERLQTTFLGSEWAQLAPLAIEIEIDFTLETADGPHIIISKLDAVYERGDRIEIVDWKTGKAPDTEREQHERMLQLALYRHAYHRRFGVPLDRIDVALFYVSENIILRGADYSEDDLLQRWSAAWAAR